MRYVLKHIWTYMCCTSFHCVDRPHPWGWYTPLTTIHISLRSCGWKIKSFLDVICSSIMWLQIESTHILTSISQSPLQILSHQLKLIYLKCLKKLEVSFVHASSDTKWTAENSILLGFTVWTTQIVDPKLYTWSKHFKTHIPLAFSLSLSLSLSLCVVYHIE